MGRILAIDYGKKRVGLAVTDPLGMIANGLTALPEPEVIPFLTTYCATESVDCIVVGQPRRWNNQAPDVESAIAGFLKRLQKALPEMRLEREDERFTSLLASRALLDGGAKKKDRQNKGLVDQVSATIILQSYLERAGNPANKNDYNA